MRPTTLTAAALVAAFAAALPANSTAIAKAKTKQKEAYAGCRCYCLNDCRKFCSDGINNNPLGFAICFRPCAQSCFCTMDDVANLCWRLEDKEANPWDHNKIVHLAIDNFPTVDSQDKGITDLVC